MSGLGGQTYLQNLTTDSSSKTITPAGSTGAKTINAASGCVRFAAGAASLVITNSLVNMSSLVMLQIAANDSSCNYVTYVPANGTLTILAPTAPAAEMRVNFLILN